MGDKGQFEITFFMKLLWVLLGVVFFIIIYLLISGNLTGAIDFIKDLFRLRG